MPFELIVFGSVIVAFVAIAARFMPRDASGARRLPRIVDESVGMYVLRRAVGRPTEAASDRAAAEAEAAAIVPEDEIAYRIGVPGAPEPTVPARFVVSEAPPQAHKIPPVMPIATRPVAGGRPQARRPAALPLRRGLAGGVTMLALALVAFAALSLPRGPQQAVLSATGTPGLTTTPLASALAVVPSPSVTSHVPATPGPTAIAAWSHADSVFAARRRSRPRPQRRVPRRRRGRHRESRQADAQADATADPDPAADATADPATDADADPDTDPRPRGVDQRRSLMR